MYKCHKCGGTNFVVSVDGPVWEVNQYGEVSRFVYDTDTWTCTACGYSGNEYDFFVEDEE